ncbi:LysR family transcriptional regulator [Fusobacterium ulcerans]|uniref:LysR family transcriptional regulator n=1 Tax=Fusobacterium ulcerans TaxID=861 RepID=UPI001D0ACAD6|nr:LysR family transcriptional regulator [Fusobacterium ulcerans]MCB8563925.1 LysR family transcriptional regulator [Fusobacterium ulcerans]MCB8648234.1 LysR family transcriptional regulator [Fusobacterium ulcerans]
MTFQQIQYIIEISRCGSISKASKNLYVAQPYLSKLLKELEEEMGITIFNRNIKGVDLTDEGKEFINHVRPLLEQKKKIIEMYSQHKTNPTMYAAVSTQRYPFVIKAFIEFFKEKITDKFEIHIREVGMYKVINDVYSKRSTIGIIFISELTEKFLKKVLASKDIEFYAIVKLTPCVFFHKNHPLAQKDEISINDLYDFPFASFEEDASSSMDFAEEFLLYDFNLIEKKIFVEDRGTMINILTNTRAFSIGTGILPTGYAGPEIISKPIIQYKDEIRLGWIKLSNTKLDNGMDLFIENIKNTVSETIKNLN